MIVCDVVRYLGRVLRIPRGRDSSLAKSHSRTQLAIEHIERKIVFSNGSSLAAPNSSLAGPFFTTGGVAFFRAQDATSGQELWRTDGTPTGTRLAADLYPGAEMGLLGIHGVAGDYLYFTARDNGEFQTLWQIRSRSQSPEIVARMRKGESILQSVPFGDSLAFCTDFFPGNSLWISDGSDIGTSEIYMSPPTSSITGPVVLGGKLVFFVTVRDANWQPVETQLWTSDGTAVNTKKLGSILGLTGVSLSPQASAIVNGKLVFRGEDKRGGELWATNGTAAGTRRIKDISPGMNRWGSISSSWPDSFTACGNFVYFTASGPEGRELWKTDGSGAGTVLVKDIAPGSGLLPWTDVIGPRDSSPDQLTAWGNTLYFSAIDESHGRELWRSDGTAAGTTLVKDIVTAEFRDASSNAAIPGSSQPVGLTPFKNSLYFLAASRLWKTDGTSAGTREVRSLNASISDADPIFSANSGSYASMAVLNGRLIFSTFGDTDFIGPVGTEPWVSDGTTAGTQLLANIFPEPKSIQLKNLIPALPERPPRSTRRRVADIVNATGESSGAFALTGRDAASFEIDGASLYLKSGIGLDFETKDSFNIAVTFQGSASADSPRYQVDYLLAVTDVNEAPTRIALRSPVPSLAENTAVRQPFEVARVRVFDDALGSNAISVSGADASFFSIIGGSLFLRTGVELDFETRSRLSVVVTVGDSTIPASSPLSTTYSLSILDVNEPPSRVAFSDAVAKLTESTSTAQRIQVAKIIVTDDSAGSHQLSLSGADAAFFALEGTSLFLKPGVKLSVKLKPRYSVVVSASDPSFPTAQAVSATYTLAITRTR